MCGRYTVYTEDEIIEMRKIIEEVSRRFSGQPVATGEVFPTNLAPVLWMEESRLAPRPMQWGFPKWDGKGSIINARSETVIDKPMFRSAIMERRCVIPSTGYFEWQQIEGQRKKLKNLFNMPGSDMLYMAGISRVFKDAQGQPYETYCILTTAAIPSIAHIHDRMPVILRADERTAWIADNKFMSYVLERPRPELIFRLAG